MKACVCFIFFSFRRRVLSWCVAGGLQWGGVRALTPVLLLFHLLQSEDPLALKAFSASPCPTLKALPPTPSPREKASS